MKKYFAVLVVLAVSGIVCAADGPNTPPAASVQKKPHMHEHSGDRMLDGQGIDRMMQARPEIRERLAERYEEYIKWLEKNYPDEAKDLAKVKEENPDRYLGRLKVSIDKYGRLAYADKTNPELAKILRQDIELKNQIDKKIAQIRATKDENQKKSLLAELQTLVSSRFDNIVAQKQIKFQDLNKKLENLKKEISKQESDLDKLKARKNEEVKKRVEELLNQTEEIHWD